jgi:hypothetical protein
VAFAPPFIPFPPGEGALRGDVPSSVPEPVELICLLAALLSLWIFRELRGR